MKAISRNWKIIACFSLLGGMLPIVLALTADYFHAVQMHEMSFNYFDHAGLSLCPPCIAGLANMPNNHLQYAIGGFVILINALIYTVIGSFLWLGFTKTKTLLVIPIALGAGMLWWGSVFVK